jgi:hypothetical protein
MILSLPLFPSQDGPIHLYYLDILRGLLSHSGPYSQYFEIKSYLTPYSLEYYSLLGLECVFSPLVSEKILICIYVLVFVSGFRYLVGSVSARPGPWVLAGALFCINFYLYMGFLNYAFGTAVLLWLAGYWLRWMNALTTWRLVRLFAGFLLLSLTHPLPPAIFLLFACLHCGISLSYERKSTSAVWTAIWRDFRRPLFALILMGLASFAWIIRFAGDHLRAPERETKELSLFIRFIREIIFYDFEPVHGAVCRPIAILIVAAAILVLITASRSQRCAAQPVYLSIIAFSVICFVVSCLAHESISGRMYFAERFSIFWLLFLIAAASSVKIPGWCRRSVGVLTVGAWMTFLPFQWIYLSTTARDLSAALQVPAVTPGSLGAIMARRAPVNGPVVKPFMWGSAHFFRQSQSILTNAPWTDESHIMIRPVKIFPWTYESDPRYTSQEIIDALNRGKDVPLDFLVQDGEGDASTEETVRRLGATLAKKTPEISFYTRH